jgi:hypothetical protein
MKNKKARVIAFYLPQFHPIPENNEWWGNGFTEWTNVAKAKPLFNGHYQPKIPADLGFYDLRLSEVREEQAKMAREAGIEGFCYWHYWFGEGKRLLEKPFNEVLKSGSPDFPFCIGWANHSWSNKTWEKGSTQQKESLLVKQVYSVEDYKIHFYEVLKAFLDKRYIKVDGKPLFVVFDPLGIPDAKEFVTLWQELARENGLPGIHFVGIASNLSGFKTNSQGKKKYYFVNPNEKSIYRYKKVLDLGFDAINSRGLFRAELKVKGRVRKLLNNFIRNYLGCNFIDKYSYKKIIKYLYVEEDALENVYPTILPNWDRSARSGRKAVIYHNSTPELFKKNIESALDIIRNKEDEHKILFLMSWNEWAEGNYVEPDLRYGKGYLNAIKEVISK